MSLFASTASAATPVAITGSDIRTQADYDQYINTYYDNLVDEFKGEINEAQLASLFADGSQKNDIEVTKTKVQGHNVAGLNADGDTLDFIQWGQGWAYSWYVFPYRIASRHTRHLEEVDNFGAIGQEADELMDSGKRTLYYALADVFNRAIAPTNAPFLCYDGMYLIDASRPNPVVGVPQWSNTEATSDWTEDALFQAQLNAKHTIASNGDRMPLSISKILLPDAYDQEAWKLNNTTGTMGTAMNDSNWAKGRFKYETVSEFTSNNVFYVLGNPKSKDNGLELRWAVRPNTADIRFEDPDVIGKRLRFRFGIGCLDPRKMFRGGALNAL